MVRLDFSRIRMGLAMRSHAEGAAIVVTRRPQSDAWPQCHASTGERAWSLLQSRFDPSEDRTTRSRAIHDGMPQGSCRDLVGIASRLTAARSRPRLDARVSDSWHWCHAWELFAYRCSVRPALGEMQPLFSVLADWPLFANHSKCERDNERVIVSCQVNTVFDAHYIRLILIAICACGTAIS